jgi:hypothetical protein
LCRPAGLAHGLDRARFRRNDLSQGGSPQAQDYGWLQGGPVPGPGLALVEAMTHVLLDACNPRLTDSQELPFSHHSHQPLAAALAPAARPSHQDVLPARLGTLAAALALAPAARPSHYDVLPARLGTRQGASCPTCSAAHILLGDPRPAREQQAEPRALTFLRFVMAVWLAPAPLLPSLLLPLLLFNSLFKSYSLMKYHGRTLAVFTHEFFKISLEVPWLEPVPVG